MLNARRMIAGLAVAGLGGVAAVAIAAQPDGGAAPASVASAEKPQVRTEVVKRTKHVRDAAGGGVAAAGGGSAPVGAAPAPAGTVSPAAGSASGYTEDPSAEDPSSDDGAGGYAEDDDEDESDDEDASYEDDESDDEDEDGEVVELEDD